MCSSDLNPVRVFMPPGQRAYLARLRCADGSLPRGINRIGSFGGGPFGTVLDGYSLACGGKAFTIFMDMYHRDYMEKRPVPGFIFEGGTRT